MTLTPGVTRRCTALGDHRMVDLIYRLLVVCGVGLGIVAELEVVVGAGHASGSGAHCGCFDRKNLIWIFLGDKSLSWQIKQVLSEDTVEWWSLLLSGGGGTGPNGGLLHCERILMQQDDKWPLAIRWINQGFSESKELKLVVHV